MAGPSIDQLKRYDADRVSFLARIVEGEESVSQLRQPNGFMVEIAVEISVHAVRADNVMNNLAQGMADQDEGGSEPHGRC